MTLRRSSWPSSASRPVVTPLQPSVVYASATPDALDDQYTGVSSGYTYAREGHPNADVLAGLIDGLEGTTGGFITGSGMAAITAVMFALTKTGDHIVAGNQLYGRSLRMLNEELPRMGVTSTLADPTDPAAIKGAMRPETRMILIETVSNPTLRVAALDEISDIARDAGVLLVVDNTFTTPRAYKPLLCGADVVVHSVTKLLAGHSDATLGYVAAKDEAHRAALVGTIVTLGLTPSPFDCWLAERGLYSFDLRYDRACENARTLADAIAEHPNTARVLYPGRSDHFDHNRAMALFDGQGGNMVSFEVVGGRAAANALTTAASMIAFAPTLGDIGTTLSHPASSSHRALSAEDRSKLGLSEGFFRISVGIEPIDQLVEDFRTALDAVDPA